MTQIILWNSYGAYQQPNTPQQTSNFDINNYATVRPLGAHAIASWLRHNGFTVAVIDFCNWLLPEKLIDITESYISSDTIAIGVSSTWWYYTSGRSMMEPQWVIQSRSKIESKYPAIKWLIGGAKTINHTMNWVSFVAHSEDTVLKYLTDSDTNRKFDIKTSATIYTDRDFIRPTEVLSMELGRGCKFKCKFCSYPLIGKKPGTYIKNMHGIRNELIRNYEQFGVTRYNFIDDTVNEDEEKIENLARLAQSLPFELEWVGYCRADLIWSRPNTIKTLRDSGLRSVFFGIESFHKEASMIIGKGWSGKHAKEFLLRLKSEWKDSVSMSIGLIAGLPKEPLNSLDEHNEWLMKHEIGRWVFGPLHIEKDGTHTLNYGANKVKPALSEFDRNYHKYGIKFDDNYQDIRLLHQPNQWYHDESTVSQAIHKANELNKRAFPKIRNAGYTVSGYCTTMGYSYMESMNRKLIDLHTPQHDIALLTKIQSNLDEYANRHLS